MRTRNLIMAAGLLMPLAIPASANACDGCSPFHLDLDLGWEIRIGSSHSCHRHCRHVDETVEYEWVERGHGRLVLRYRKVWYNRYYDTYEYGPWHIELKVCGPRCRKHHCHRYHHCDRHCRHPRYSVRRHGHGKPSCLGRFRYHHEKHRWVPWKEHHDYCRRKHHHHKSHKRHHEPRRKREVRAVPGKHAVSVQTTTRTGHGLRKAVTREERKPIKVIRGKRRKAEVKVKVEEKRKGRKGKERSRTIKRSVRSW